MGQNKKFDAVVVGHPEYAYRIADELDRNILLIDLCEYQILTRVVIDHSMERMKNGLSSLGILQGEDGLSFPTTIENLRIHPAEKHTYNGGNSVNTNPEVEQAYTNQLKSFIQKIETRGEHDIVILHHPDAPGTMNRVCNGVGALGGIYSRADVDYFIEFWSK